MQGPGDSDPGEEAAEATPDARSVSAHGRAGGVRGRQRELMESTLLEGRGLAWRLLGETQDADQGEMVTQVMSCLEADGTCLVEQGEQSTGVPESLGSGRQQLANERARFNGAAQQSAACPRVRIERVG